MKKRILIDWKPLTDLFDSEVHEYAKVFVNRRNRIVVPYKNGYKLVRADKPRTKWRLFFAPRLSRFIEYGCFMGIVFSRDNGKGIK